MATTIELETILHNELKIWFTRQNREPLADFYLYYLAATPEHDGGLLICRSDLLPENPEYCPAMLSPISKAASIAQNFDYIKAHILRTLPIFS